jgi:light-regulated signal transduction histidine kinase (bacteriophytochrome)
MSDDRRSLFNESVALQHSFLCEREPIHIPGAIQPHGALLADLAEGLIVTHASANLAEIFGLSAVVVLGQRLADAIGEAACHALLTGTFDDGPMLGLHILSKQQGGMLHLQAYRSGRHICIDIEPIEPQARSSSTILELRSALARFQHATEIDDLCDRAVSGLKAIAGYDRVIAYRFAPDGHIEVIAEAREPRLDPYLGLHYPASDLPEQARLQYFRQRVGAVADSNYQPVPLLSDVSMDDGAPLDLTHSSLRSVSPIHRHYMRNMRTVASLTVGLTQKQALWGMLVCHHATQKVAGMELRAAADTIGQVVSQLLTTLDERKRLTHRLHRVNSMRPLADRLTTPALSPEILAAIQDDLLNLVSAAGALVSLSGNLYSIGQTPPPLSSKTAIAVMRNETRGEPVAIDNLGLRYLQLADCTRDGAGLCFCLSQRPQTISSYGFGRS